MAVSEIIVYGIWFCEVLPFNLGCIKSATTKAAREIGEKITLILCVNKNSYRQK